jgi:hypothetical protein
LSRASRRRRCSPIFSPSRKAGGNASDKSKPNLPPSHASSYGSI